jgi:hypothetical protein
MHRMALTDRELAVLGCEGSWWVGDDAPRTKAEAIEALGLSKGQYYAVLDGLLDRADAALAAPLVVRRVQRAKAARRRARFEGPRMGTPGR